MRVLAVVHEEDAGPGVFGQLVRESGHELLEWAPPCGEPPPEGFDAALVFGGGMHLDQEQANLWLPGEKQWIAGLLERRVPTLGVCLGAQLVAAAAGASVGRAGRPEIGWHEVRLTDQGTADPLLGGRGRTLRAFEWHSYHFTLPPGAVELARSETCLQAFRLRDFAWGIQFHAEVRRKTAAGWLRDYGRGEDAVAAGLDPAALLVETRRRIPGWNDAGREICARFLATATA